MRVQLDGLRESQTAAESESGDLRVEAAEHDLKLQVCARWSVCLADSTAPPSLEFLTCLFVQGQKLVRTDMT